MKATTYEKICRMTTGELNELIHKCGEQEDAECISLAKWRLAAMEEGEISVTVPDDPLEFGTLSGLTLSGNKALWRALYIEICTHAEDIRHGEYGPGTASEDRIELFAKKIGLV